MNSKSRAPRYANRYKKKIALGLCRSGGCARLPEPNKTLCQRCLNHRKRYNRQNGYVMDSSIPPPGYVSPLGLALALNVWFNTVYLWVRKGAPTYRRYGRLWFSVERVQSWRANRDGIYQEEA